MFRRKGKREGGGGGEGEEQEGGDGYAPSCIEVASVGPVGYAHINPRLPSRFTRYNYLPGPTGYLI